MRGSLQLVSSETLADKRHPEFLETICGLTEVKHAAQPLVIVASQIDIFSDPHDTRV